MKGFTNRRYGSFWFILILGLLPVSCERREPLETGVVQLSVLMEPDATGVWRKLFQKFQEQHPGIRIQYIEGPTATNTREDLYATTFLSGQAIYDLIYADVVWVPKFAAAGWLEDVTDRWDAAAWKQFIPGSLEGSQYRGRIYRVPVQMDAGVLFYRQDILESAGEAPPATLDDLARIARKLQRPGELWGFVWQGKQYEGLSCVFLEILVAYGGFWIEPQSNAVGLDQPAAVAALQFLTDCVQKWKISPPGVTTYAEEESRRLFESGHAIFLRNWPYVWPLSEQADSPIRGKVGLMPMPKTAQGKPAAALGGWGFAIAKSSRHKQEAWEFCKFMATVAQARRLHAATGMQPALKQFYEESTEPAQKAIYAVLQRAVPRPQVAQYAQASDILQRYVSAALTGSMPPEEAMRRAGRETRLLLGSE